MSKIEDIKLMVEKGKTKIIAQTVNEAIIEGIEPDKILKVMVEAMDIIGDKFSSGKIFIPEMLISAKTMSIGVNMIKPYLMSDEIDSFGTCVIGTVTGDLHDIGKNLVAMMLESKGFNIVDLGVDVPSDKFIEAIKKNKNVTLVAVSGLLSTTMYALKESVQKIRESGLDGFKIIVGGAPVTQEFADEIGADGFAPDAGSAAVKAVELVTA